MKRILLTLLGAILIFLFIPTQVLADTGTYKIDNYTITLTPQSDGSVDISYYQQWTCLSGNIPWITVGLPNTSYTITGSGNDVSNIRDDSGSGWEGVYIGLDKTYYANQSFIVSFTVNDKNLLNESISTWGINFTAGWYDNANIGKMDINLISPINPSEYTFNTTPTSTAGNTITWEKTNLPDGYQFNISFSSTDGSFLTATTPKTSSNGTSGYVIFFIITIIVILLAVAISSAVRRSKNRLSYTSPEVSPIANKKYLGSQDPLEDEKKELEGNEDKVNEYIISEKDKVTDDEKDKQINDYAASHNLSLSGNNYIDDYGHSYTSNMLWMLIMMNSMRRSQANVWRPTHISTPSCHCACVACACACACACAGGHGAGCTIKLRDFKLGYSND